MASLPQHCPTQQRDSDKDATTLKTGLKIIAKNAKQFLLYKEGFGVLICAVHRYAVRDLAYHLQKYHIGSGKEKGEVVKIFKQHRLLEPRTVPLPSPLGALFAIT